MKGMKKLEDGIRTQLYISMLFLKDQNKTLDELYAREPADMTAIVNLEHQIDVTLAVCELLEKAVQVFN